MEIVKATGVLAFSRILIATDFSTDSMRALPYALDLTQRYGSKLYIAHVVPADVVVVAGSEQMANSLEREQRDAEFKLGNLVESALSTGVQCEPLIGTGDIGLVLKEFIGNHGVDLVVVGTVGRTGLSKVLLGSIAEELVRECDCPVLTVGRRAADVGNLHRRGILCPTDFSSESLEAVPYTVSLAEKYDCPLVMLHCLEGIRESPYVESQLAKARLRDLVPDRLKAEVLVELGSPAALISDLVESRNFGLVVMGARGAGSFARARSHFGSIAHKIITHAPCPVLTVRKQK
jgi:nucleotide-binding universal stress UspA family protein